MKQKFEYDSYNGADRIAMLENKAAELERQLRAATPPGGFARWPNAAVPSQAFEDPDFEEGDFEEPDFGDASFREPDFEEPDFAEPDFAEPDFAEPDFDDAHERDGAQLDEGERHWAKAARPAPSPRAARDGRTEALLSHGRRGARRSRMRWALSHWRMITVAASALVIGIATTLLILPDGGGSWPASVAQVKTQIKQACENPDVAAEPSGLNFACGTDTQAVLWVFSLLTSGDNPDFVDKGTGRSGLEPISAEQGGNIAWPLNLHHPYNPASPVDSLEVAARAINNIISGATVTNASGVRVVEAGLESKAANCQRYTGSAQLVSKAGYPARCASAVTSPAGQAALVSDVFEQWMGGSQTQLANEAGILFENAGNPGNQQVQAILATLPGAP